MSVIHEKSPKHCAEKQAHKSHKLNKKLFLCISTFLLTTLSLILLIWFTLHPTNPHFSLKQADIHHPNATLPLFLNSSVRLTLLSTNPNKKVGIHYDRFLVHASYNSHAITPNTPIPSFYQHHEETNLLTVSLAGNYKPLDPSPPYRALHDEAAGNLTVGFTVTGRLRWKVGSWVSRRYRFNVDCVVTFVSSGHNASSLSSPKQGAECSTSV